MKSLIVLLLLSQVAVAQNKIKTVAPVAAKPLAKAEPKESAAVLNKSPKAIFLIKRAKVDADIGEPVLYPFERQMKNVYYDLHGGVLRNE